MLLEKAREVAVRAEAEIVGERHHGIRPRENRSNTSSRFVITGKWHAMDTWEAVFNGQLTFPHSYAAAAR